MKMFNISSTTFYNIKNDLKLKNESEYSYLKPHVSNIGCFFIK